MSSKTCFITGAQAIRARSMACALAGLVLVFATPLPGEAEARTRSYAIADFETGQILKSVNADKRLSPASLTKMMTLYLVFEAIRDGKLSLDQKVTVSKRAAGMPPTKLGLRAGQRVRLRHMIAAAAVKSANDAAVVLAEAVAGTEWGFAERMTRKARALGMSRSSFKNATGFTAKGHLSTARDMALLGRRLMRDFPEHAATFKRRSIRWNGRRLRATNTRYLNAYSGADGIKTGYTRAAGYTIVASAVRKNRRVVVSYFGAKSTRQRTKRVIQLMDIGFGLQKKASSRLAGLEPPAPAPRDPPQAAATPATPAAPVAAAAPSSPPAGAASRTKKPWAVQVGAFRKKAQAQALLDSLAERQPEITARSEDWVFLRRGLYLARLRGFDETGAQSACTSLKAAGTNCFIIPAPAAPATTASAVRTAVLGARNGNWAVQVGSYSQATHARARLDKLRASGFTWLKDRPIRVPRPDDRHYLAWFVGFDEASARLACEKLKDRRIDCLPVLASTPEKTAAAGAAAGAATAPQSGKWQVQLGSFRRQNDARKELRRVQRAEIPELREHTALIRKRRRHHLVRFQGFGPEEARTACKAARLKGFECLAVAPSAAASPQSGKWQVQLGSFRRKNDASKELRRVQRAKISELREHASLIRKHRRHHLVRFQGFGPEEARTACEAARLKGFECLAVAPSAAASPASQRSDWAIQVGAYGKSSQALAQLQRVEQDRIGELANARRWVPKPGRYYLARFRNLDETGASAACDRLRAQGVDCLALAPTVSP